PVASVVLDPTRLTFVVPATTGEKSVDVVLRNLEGLDTTLVRGLIYTQEFSLDPSTTTFTDAKARHLFRRAAFGATPARIAQAVADGLTVSTDKLVSFTNDAAVENAALAFYPSPPPVGLLNERTNKEWWIHQILSNPNPFQDRLAWFLHDHFATSERGWNQDAIWFLHEQIKTLRRFSVATGDTIADGQSGLGYDWRAILIAMAKDRAMLEWLDGRQSTATAPNENWARELWELFMLGEGVGYTEADIKEAAKAFTGFFWLRLPGQQQLEMRYRPSRHHTGDKTILGVTGKFGYDDISPLHETNSALATDPVDTGGGVVALTLARRPVEASQFICRKLAEFFLYEGQDDSVVNALAADLRAPGANQWNLKPILLKIFRSKAMYSARALKGKVKSPVEFVMGFLRTTDIRLNANIAVNASQIRTRLINIGQVPIEPPDVNGWPTGSAWMGSQTMVERYNFLNFAVMQLDLVPQIDPLVPPVGQRGATALVDHIAGLLDTQLSGNARTEAIAYVNSYLNPANGAPLPYNPADTQHVKTKARGLLYLIAQYHDAQQD
ncbi:MAG: DUF1800 domain-containing protein, partial [Planctomycetes bacterium]|nr:DUF1800 domain-containing protein [Planctomycetota bacterium]